MRVLAFFAALGFSLILGSAVAAEPPSPASLLGQMTRAATDLNYEGRLVVVSGSRVSAVRLVHVRENGQEWERLVHLDGKHREVVRGQGDTLLLSDNSVAALLEHLAPRAVVGIEQRLEAISRSYDLKVGGLERVAGREAWPLAMNARDDARFNRQLWMDKETGLLLKSVVSEPKGRALETLSFSEIKTGPAVGLDEYRSAQKILAGMRKGDKGDVGKKAGTSNEVPILWRLDVPSGFLPVRNTMTRKSLNGSDVDSLTYSDGLATFSFFAEFLDAADRPADQARRVGALVSASRVRHVGGKRVLITVMGSLPASEAIRIADTAQYVGASN